MNNFDFASTFTSLTGKKPFPWQQSLFARLAEGDIPSCCDLPTGLGKTSVIAVWLIALAKFPTKVPRRLVYIVNRRTVVDQTTVEAEKLKRKIKDAELQNSLLSLCALPTDSPLAISTLRGQFADNREWSADPCRPAVIIGTVDMMGSRLLFSGYRLGFKSKPLHAGFLGQDTLIVHDEAHLEPAFQSLLSDIEQEQTNGRDARKTRVLELSATSRSRGITFCIGSEDERHPVVAKRLRATKRLTLHETTAASVTERIIELAKRHEGSGRSVLVFVNGIRSIEQVSAAFGSRVERLTGTMRGKERDELVKTSVFRRFLQQDDVPADAKDPADGTVYLVCTSAGEVGVNISADHLVCDLSTFDSMAQRFGRVNRFGESTDSKVDVVHPTFFEDKDPRKPALLKTLEVLRFLDGDASPNAIRKIDPQIRQEAFAQSPEILPTSDILFDAWSLTTITGYLAGRPPVEPYLHGKPDESIPETAAAWRDEVEFITGSLRSVYPPDKLLADYPLKPHELLKDTSARIWETLSKIVARDSKKGALPAWLVDEEGEVEFTTVGELSQKESKDRLGSCTLLLPPTVGGLRGGLLDATSDDADDISNDWRDEQGTRRRLRIWDGETELEAETIPMRLIREIDVRPNSEEEEDEEESTVRKHWRWFESPRSADTEGSRFARENILLTDHTTDVEKVAYAFAKKSGLSTELADAVRLAGKFHDLGKRRSIWQRSIGNWDTDVCLAKSGRHSDISHRTSYRHEFGSLLDISVEPDFQKLPEEMKDIVLHLVAVHHGRARPHFSRFEGYDPSYSQEQASSLTIESARRFARLQLHYGRWGLAWLESLLRAADYAASERPGIAELIPS